MRDVSVVIPTFRRPHLLRQTVISCLNQKNSLKLDYQIVVVDNSPEKSAQADVEKNDAGKQRSDFVYQRTHTKY